LFILYQCRSDHSLRDEKSDLLVCREVGRQGAAAIGGSPLTNWDDVKRKIQELGSNPFLDADMLRTLDSVSMADYWRRRFEEEQNLNKGRVEAREGEILVLKERLERQNLETQLLRQQIDAGRTQLMDRQHYWEERHHTLEMENRSLRERMEWEVKSRVLEEQNRFLMEQGRRRTRDVEDTEHLGRAMRQEIDQIRTGAAEEVQGLRAAHDALAQEKARLDAQLADLQGEKARWQTQTANFQNEKGQWEEQIALLRQEKSQADLKLRAAEMAAEEETARVRRLEKDLAVLRAEAKDWREKMAPLAARLEQAKRGEEARRADAHQFLQDVAAGFAEKIREHLRSIPMDAHVESVLKALEELQLLLGLPEMSPETLDVNDFVSRTLASTVEKAAARGVNAHWRLADTLPPIKLDLVLLGEALLAVVTNALEAMPAEGNLTVETFMDYPNRQIKIRVQDSGAGLPGDLAQKVFRPYFSTKTDHKGLGLALARRVTDVLGGVLTLESVDGQGTTVTLSFPVEEAPARAAKEV